MVSTQGRSLAGQNPVVAMAMHSGGDALGKSVEELERREQGEGNQPVEPADAPATRLSRA